MATEDETPEQVKALVAGPLGLELSKFPLRFATPAFFGSVPKRGEEMTVSSGSASLLRIGGRPFALTCAHVLDGYREQLATDSATIFQLSNCKLDPLKQIAAEDRNLDFALIGLTELQAAEMTVKDGELGTLFAELAWPPGRPVEDGYVTFGGFPGDLRRVRSFDELSFGSFSLGASRVSAVGDTYAVCQFEREYWVKHGFEAVPDTIRGMSGGPVFAMRKSPQSGVMSYEFVGHIYEFSEEFDLLRIRLAAAIPLALGGQ